MAHRNQHLHQRQELGEEYQVNTGYGHQGNQEEQGGMNHIAGHYDAQTSAQGKHRQNNKQDPGHD